MTKFVDKVYEIVKRDTEGLDSIYEDYIVNLVGEYGLLTLKVHKLVETCGVVNGRQLYTLLEKGEP